MVEAGMIFISYVRDDSGTSGAARRIRDALAAAVGDAALFFDEESIRPGSSWNRSIERGLRRAEVLVLVLSPAWRELALPKLTTEGEVVRREVVTVRDAGRPIVPVLVGAQLPRAIDAPGLPLLSQVQWLAVPEPDDPYQVDRAVEAILDRAVGRDVARLRSDRADPVVTGLSDLLAMRPAHRRAVGRLVNASTSPAPLAASLLALIDHPVHAGPTSVGGLAGLLSDIRGVRLLDTEERSLHRLRESARRVHQGLAAERHPLDRALALTVDAALDRASWLRFRSATGRPDAVVEARRIIDRVESASRRRAQAVAEFVFDRLMDVSDPALHASLRAVRPWNSPVVRQPRAQRRRAGPRGGGRRGGVGG